MTTGETFSLAELIVVAAAEAWRDDGELLATGIGPLPRLAVSLAKKTFAPGLVMTDGEAFSVEEPVPLGPRGGFRPRAAGWMPYSRVFDSVWSGRRHAMVTPVQVDRKGQANISALGPHSHPKVQMLGMRGFPGNSVNHRNSMFLPNHNKRTFIEGAVDMVSSVGETIVVGDASPARHLGSLGLIVTNLCVFDFHGADGAARVLSLHPGVTFEEVRDATGFPIVPAPTMKTTVAPTSEQLAVIRALDPHGVRTKVLKGDPPGMRG